MELIFRVEYWVVSKVDCFSTLMILYFTNKASELRLTISSIEHEGTQAMTWQCQLGSSTAPFP